jgi:23S rRNA G2445 N2-methylase RlmL
MCGSGTFLIEAYDFFRPNNTREFSYQNTPYFRELKQLPTTLPNLNNKLFSGFKGVDIDPNIIHEAIINKKSREILFSVQDVFHDTKVEDENIIAILNPPYGKRVGNKNDIDINYYLKIIRSIHNKYKTKRIGIIIPSEYPLKSSKELKVAQAIPFKNGGLSVIFYILDL